jgi:hypothetical protein
MKFLLAAIIVIVLFVPSVARAANLRLYFSTAPLNDGVLDFVPPEYLTQTNPVVSLGTPTYFNYSGAKVRLAS